MDIKYFFDKELNVLKEFYAVAKAPFDQAVTDAEAEYHQWSGGIGTEGVDEGPPIELEAKYERATACRNLLTQACLSAVQQVLKEYLNEYLGDRGCWPEAERLMSSLKKSGVSGWLERYKMAFRDLMGCDWDRSPVRLSLFEEMILARNVIQHEGHIGLLDKSRDQQYKSKYPISLYSDETFPELISVTDMSLRIAMDTVNDFVVWLEKTRVAGNESSDGK
ncbi:MAG: hypothetical protein ACLQOO_33945 [Terriglobia bacterium]